MKHSFRTTLSLSILVLAGYALLQGCKPKGAGSATSSDAASKVYVAPGKYDEFYDFVSGGFSGQMSVYGLPSGRLLRVIPVFSVDPEKGWGYSEETKPMLNTSNGFIPWDDLHHIALSETDGIQDGRWVFANGNNTRPHVVIILTDWANNAGVTAMETKVCKAGDENKACGKSFPVVQSPKIMRETCKAMKQQGIARMQYTGRWGIAFFLYMDKHNGQMPANFEEARFAPCRADHAGSAVPQPEDRGNLESRNRRSAGHGRRRP